MKVKAGIFSILVSLGTAAASSAVTSSPTAAATTEWRYFGGSKHFDRYAPLSQVDRATVSQLQTLWTRPGLDPSLTQEFPDLVPSNYLRGTPVIVDGVLYAPNAVGLVEAFDPLTGKTLWVQKPYLPTLKEAAGQSTRGVDYWQHGADRRIVTVRGEYLYLLDANTGARVPGFGEGGRVSLNRHTPDAAPYFGFNGPLVVGDVIVVGGNGGGKAGGGYGDGGPEIGAKPEDIRGFDVRTGKPLWQFHLIPGPGEPGHDTWGKGSADEVGNMAAWAPLSADEQLGYVYVPLSAPTNSYYGGHRPGNNLYANSLVALNARTGKLVWYFQMVHHDLFDYDNASAPVLGDITVDGKRIKAVMQPNKNGFIYVFDRVTGKPVWPIIEKPVPQGILPGEATSPTQPFPTRPPAFDRQGITAEDLIDFTPALHEQALKFMQSYVTGPLYTPPSLKEDPATGKKGTLAMPGAWGSGNWNNGAFDPETGIYYSVSMTLPGVYGLQKTTGAEAQIAYEFPEPRGEGPPEPPPLYGPGPQGLPLLKPPYGRITAIDMNKGEKLWAVANGDGPRNHPLLKDLHLPPLGSMGRPVPLLTKTLLFLGESSDALFGGAGVGGPAHFTAYDKATGAVLWQTTLPAGTTGGPITYEVHGQQIIVVPIGGKDYGTAWVAFGLKH